MTTITISGLNEAPSIQPTGNLIIDQNSGTYRATITDLVNYLSSTSFSAISATSGSFNSLAVGAGITAATLSTSGDVIIGGNLTVLNMELVDGQLMASLFGNVTGNVTGNLFGNVTGNVSSVPGIIGNINAIITIGNQPYITNLGNITLNNLKANSNVSIGSNLIVSGITTVSSPIVPVSNAAAINIGSTTNWFNNIYGTAVHALYADLAERYTSDSDYAPGTVVIFGTNSEVTASYQPNDTRVAGVISTNPAYTMNAGISGQNVVNVALQGRVPCQVTGKVTRGDLMVSSAIPGVAMTNNTPAVGTVIGKALANYTGSGVGVIEVVVGKV